MHTLAARLRVLLRGRVQAEEARALHVHRSTLNGWLSGRSEPNSETLQRICERHGVSADWLLGLSDSRSRRAAAAGGEVAEPLPPSDKLLDPLVAVMRIERVVADQVETLQARVRALEKENTELRSYGSTEDVEQEYLTEVGRIWEEILGDLPRQWQVRILRRLGVMGAGGALGEHQGSATTGRATG